MPSRSLMPPDSISKLPVHDGKTDGRPIRASPRGGPRSITPPRSISQTPAHIVPHSETPLGLSSSVKRDPPGMQRGVTPAGSVITTNRYGGEAPWGGKVEAGNAYQGRQGRSILPPAPFANEFGGSGYDSSAMMMQDGSYHAWQDWQDRARQTCRRGAPWAPFPRAAAPSLWPCARRGPGPCGGRLPASLPWHAPAARSPARL